MKRSFFIISILLCCFISPVLLDVNAKPSDPVFEWSVPLGADPGNIVGYDSAGNLFVHHEEINGTYKVMTKYTPEGDILLEERGGPYDLHREELETGINGSDWLFSGYIVSHISPYFAIYAYDNYFNDTSGGIHIENLYNGHYFGYDPFCFSNDDYLFMLNYIFVYNSTTDDYDFTGEVHLQKFYFEVILESFLDDYWYDFESEELWNVSFIPEGNVVEMFVNNGDLVIGTTTNFYILDTTTGTEKMSKSFKKEISYYAPLDDGIIVAYWEDLPDNSTYVFEYYDYNGDRKWRETLPLSIEEQLFRNMHTYGKYLVFSRWEGLADSEWTENCVYVYNSKGVLQTSLDEDLAGYDGSILFYTDIMPSTDSSFYCVLYNSSSTLRYLLMKYSFIEVSGIDGFSALTTFLSVFMIIFLARSRRIRILRQK